MSVITHRTPIVPPALPALGAAGSSFVDPSFGSRMIRVTDAAFCTDIGDPDKSYHSSASGYQREWNCTSTKFWLSTSAGGVLLVSFNAAGFTTTRLGSTYLQLTGDLAWSETDPDLIYGIGLAADHHTLVTVNTATTPPTVTTLLDLDTITAGLTSASFVGSLSVANNKLFCIYGASQDTHRYVLHYPLDNPAGAQVLNTMTSPLMPDFLTLHSAQIDKTGRVISLIPGISGTAFPVYFWDTTLNTVTGGTGPNSGHEVLGYLTRINNDSLGTYDSRKWVLTPNLLAPNTGKISLPGEDQPLTPVVGGWGADHSCWHNATAATPLVPIISGTYRYGDGPEYGTYPVLDHTAFSPPFLTPWRAWDDEIIGVSTDGSGIVYRYCHTRSWLFRNVPTFEPSLTSDIFWYTPRPNVSPNGRYAIFTSNWEKTLGTEAGTGIRRQDVFLVELGAADPIGPRARGRLHR